MILLTAWITHSENRCQSSHVLIGPAGWVWCTPMPKNYWVRVNSVRYYCQHLSTQMQTTHLSYSKTSTHALSLLASLLSLICLRTRKSLLVLLNKGQGVLSTAKPIGITGLIGWYHSPDLMALKHVIVLITSQQNSWDHHSNYLIKNSTEGWSYRLLCKAATCDLIIPYGHQFKC